MQQLQPNNLTNETIGGQAYGGLEGIPYPSGKQGVRGPFPWNSFEKLFMKIAVLINFYFKTNE